MSTRYALLIGIDHYFEYRLPGGIYYPRLGGCVRDINKVYGFLTTRLDVEPANVLKLTATYGGSQPYEAEAEWPTYGNMVRAFHEMTSRVQADDQLYVQFSGHGGRTTTMFPAIKGENALDEGLVPLDIGAPGARYLRDVEIHSLLQAVVDKGVRLTVVMDCCHSGGATRDIGGARKRGIGQADMSPPPTDSAVGKVPELVRAWQQDGAATSRAVNTQSSWLFEPRGYTLLAGCRANESAFEFPFDGRESNGALTYWMLDTLGQSDTDTTWKMVADRVTAKVHGQFAQQTPMLQGEGDYRVFGADKLESQYSVPVLQVEPSSRRVRINAGEAHGLGNGTQFEIYASAAEIGQEDKRLALVELTEVGATESWAEVRDPAEGFSVEVGHQAVLLNTSTMRLQHGVRVALQDARLRRQIEDAIEGAGRGFLTVSKPGDGADFLVDVDTEHQEHFAIQDSAGDPLPHISPPIRIDEENSATRLIKRLVHLAQYRTVQLLDMPSSEAANALKVEMVGNRVSKPNDTFKIKITNTQEPNPHNANDPARVLNITVLMLSSDWSVTQVYPEGAANFEPLDPGKTIDLGFEAYLNEGETESLDIFKVFATRSTTNFRWLELPSLDQPLTWSVTRSLSRDPLEAILAHAGGEAAQSRAVRLTSSPQKGKGWTVAQVEMLVTTDGKEPNRLQATADSQQSFIVSRQIDAKELGLESPDEFRIYVEFSAPPSQPSGAQSNERGLGDAATNLGERSQHAIEAAMQTIKEMALQTDMMRKGIPGGSQPRMVKIKFGISMDLQVGAFLAKSNAGAAMEVELEWARRSDDVLRVLKAETDVDAALNTNAEADVDAAKADEPQGGPH